MASNKKTNRLVVLRAQLRRWHRLVFCSPAEAEFIRLMGGRVIRLKFIRSYKNKFPMTLVLSLGPTLKAEKIHREVRAGKYFVDFSNDLRRVIEIDGEAFHRDIVAGQQRDEYLAYYGWMVLHINASSVFRHPARVRHVAESWLLNGTLPPAPKHNTYSILRSTEPLKSLK